MKHDIHVNRLGVNPPTKLTATSLTISEGVYCVLDTNLVLARTGSGWYFWTLLGLEIIRWLYDEPSSIADGYLPYRHTHGLSEIGAYPIYATFLNGKFMMNQWIQTTPRNHANIITFHDIPIISHHSSSWISIISAFLLAIPSFLLGFYGNLKLDCLPFFSYYIYLNLLNGHFGGYTPFSDTPISNFPMFSPLNQHIFSLHLCCDTIEQLILIEESAAKTSDEGVTPGTIDYADPKWVGLIDRGARNDSWENPIISMVEHKTCVKPSTRGFMNVLWNGTLKNHRMGDWRFETQLLNSAEGQQEQPVLCPQVQGLGGEISQQGTALQWKMPGIRELVALWLGLGVTKC